MVASKYSVLLDTNILMSKTLRDWILLLAVKSEYEFFTPHVSSGIMDEFGYHVRRANPAISDVVLENWKQQIIRSCISCISGFLSKLLFPSPIRTIFTCMPLPNMAPCTH